ncbi:hypothetical protein ACA910_014598 [Epithemia clementina (nom. ined.)]
MPTRCSTTISRSCFVPSVAKRRYSFDSNNLLSNTQNRQWHSYKRNFAFFHRHSFSSSGAVVATSFPSVTTTWFLSYRGGGTDCSSIYRSFSGTSKSTTAINNSISSVAAATTNSSSHEALSSAARVSAAPSASNPPFLGNKNDHIIDESSKRIFITNPKHGFRIVPFTWSELQHICNGSPNDDGGGDLSQLSRSVMQQYEYTLYRRQLESSWKSLTDHILCSKFRFEARIDKVTGLRYANPSLMDLQNDHQESSQEPPIILAVLPNDFPYFVEDGIEHWVLWKLKRGGGSGESGFLSCCSAEDIEFAKRTIASQKKPTFIVQDFIHWINPPHLKSVPEIDHVHILCLLKSTTRTTAAAPSSTL